MKGEKNLAGKRKDKKGRILLKNESERSDGRYQYRYTDVFGKRQTFYAPTLDELRQKEKELQRALDNGISYSGGKMTINTRYANQLMNWLKSTLL